MVETVDNLRKERDKLRLPFFEFRIGIHSGPVIAGIVGQQSFTFDIWGNAVNVASLMETNGEAGRVNVSEELYNHCKSYFEFSERGVVKVKNRWLVR